MSPTAGTTVWLSGFNANVNGQTGPACLPISTNLPGGASTVRTDVAAPVKELRIAA